MNENQDQLPQEELPEEPKKEYVPRPLWQVWGARVALVVFIVFLILYYINLMRGIG